ncbi:Uncharacterised protein [Pseudomonas aeruginosa]|nr:Uncharacterised protein [Pseudomonas aeruginosa]
MTPGGISASMLVVDGVGAQRLVVQFAGMRLEVLGQIDAEVGERQVGN